MSSTYASPPWKVQEVKTGAEPAVVDAHDRFIAPFVCFPRGNAQLIAAAPDLLAALSALVRDADAEPDGEYLQGANLNCVAVHRRAIERARAAITKATGDTQ